jgi:hypothetical protein
MDSVETLGGRAGGCGEAFANAAEDAFDEGGEDVLFAFEVVVDEAVAEASHAGDVGNLGCHKAPFGEHDGSGVEDLLPALVANFLVVFWGDGHQIQSLID